MFVAQNLGLKYCGDLYYDNSHLKKIGLSHFLENRFGATNRSKAENVLAGSLKEIDFLFFTYTAAKESHQLNYHDPILAISTAPYPNLPLFIIRPSEFLDGFKESMGQKFITIQPAPSLSVQIATEEEDAQAMLAHVPPAVWKVIENNQWHVIHDGHCFVVYAVYRPLKAEFQAYQYFIHQGLEIFVALLSDPTQLKKHL